MSSYVYVNLPVKTEVFFSNVQQAKKEERKNWLKGAI